jgi:DNA-directed RNA polymerase specialized sigma24 family protein
MSDLDPGTALEAEREAGREVKSRSPLRKEGELSEESKGLVASAALRELPTHNFPNDATNADLTARFEARDDEENRRLYRKKTTALLQRYMRWSLEAGRVPSLLGREFFRAKVSGRSTSFETRVIFIHDVEGCLSRLPDFDRQVIARVVLQEYDHEAAARILQCDRKTIERRLPELIDELGEAFLRADLLERLPETYDENM